MSLTKAGIIVRIDSRKGTTMNSNLSDWDWLNAALGVLFLYRGIRDLYNGTGTGWSSEDEKKHFRKFYGILLRSFAVHSIWSTPFFPGSSLCTPF